MAGRANVCFVLNLLNHTALMIKLNRLQCTRGKTLYVERGEDNFG